MSAICYMVTAMVEAKASAQAPPRCDDACTACGCWYGSVYFLPRALALPRRAVCGLAVLAVEPLVLQASLASLKARSWWPRTDTESSHTDQRRRLGVDDIIAGALFYNNVLTSSLIHTQFAYATVNHELNSHSNNEPPISQKVFMSKRT